MNVQCFASRAPQSCLCIKARMPGTAGPLMAIAMNKIRNAKYQIGQVVRHRLFPFRGVVFDIDPIFSNTEEWYESIPAEVRPHKDQPFYHLFAENDETEYIAYVSEQNLLPDTSGEPVRHPQVAEVFVQDGNGGYRPRQSTTH
jgi:heat shock protein HspQ